ncbi:MAG: AAA family ATPase [Hoeflea sp.]|uniref:AAA family ATPase n=1 Tax=Hoeflea sp. TaxID=1940281 RepID=UPI003296EDF4
MNEQIVRRSGTGFVDIAASREILKAMEIARDIPDYPVLINSKPGMGKSTALRHYSKTMEAFYCEVGQPSKGMKGMLKMIVEATGGSAYNQYSADLADTAEERLKGCWSWSQRPMLIMDEVQMLELAPLRELLRLQELSGCSLVLSGNDKRLART